MRRTTWRSFAEVDQVAEDETRICFGFFPGAASTMAPWLVLLLQINFRLANFPEVFFVPRLRVAPFVKYGEALNWEVLIIQCSWVRESMMMDLFWIDL